MLFCNYTRITVPHYSKNQTKYKIFLKLEPILFVLLLGRILRTIIYNIQHINLNILAQMDMLSKKIPY